MRPSFLISLLMALLLSVNSAHAAKFGGGKSFGYKKPIQYRALERKTAPKPPAQKSVDGVRKPAGAGNRAGLLGGLLAGGLLAALFFGGAFEGMTAGDWLVLLLLAGGLFWLLRRRRAAQPALATADVAQARVPYQDIRIGAKVDGVSDDSAQPQGAPLPAPPPWFEVERFESSLVDNFKAVQRAWDAGDVETLKSFCAPECFDAIRDDIRPETHQTEIEQVNAQVIDWDYDGDRFIVSARFSGFVRENDAPERGFTEVWHLARPVDGSGNWEIVGIQQL